MMIKNRIVAAIILGAGLGIVWGLCLIGNLMLQPWNVTFEFWFWESFKRAFVCFVSALLIVWGARLAMPGIKMLLEEIKDQGEND